MEMIWSHKEELIIKNYLKTLVTKYPLGKKCIP